MFKHGNLVSGSYCRVSDSGTNSVAKLERFSNYLGCRVRAVPSLEPFRDKQTQLLLLLEADEHHAIWDVLSSLERHDVSSLRDCGILEARFGSALFQKGQGGLEQQQVECGSRSPAGLRERRTPLIVFSKKGGRVSFISLSR